MPISFGIPTNLSISSTLTVNGSIVASNLVPPAPSALALASKLRVYDQNTPVGIWDPANEVWVNLDYYDNSFVVGNTQITNSITNVAALIFDSITAGRSYVFPDASGNVIISTTGIFSGRVPFAASNGVLTDSSAFTFSAGTLTTSAYIGASLTGPTATNLTLQGGSSGASLVLGQGASGRGTLTAASDGTFTNSPYILTLVDSTAYAAGVGGGIAFTGKYNSGGASTQLGLISGIKANATDGNFEGALTFTVRSNGSGGGAQERMRITPNNVLIGTTTDITGSGGLKVAGTTAATSTTTGALQVAGGVGIAGRVYVGSSININSSLVPATYGNLVIGTTTGGLPAAFFTDAASSSVAIDFPVASTARIRTNSGAENLSFAVNTTEVARISTGLNLLVGGTTDISGAGGAKFYGTAAATSTTSGAVQIGSNIGLSGNAGGPSYFGGPINTGVPTFRVDTGTEALRFSYYLDANYYNTFYAATQGGVAASNYISARIGTGTANTVTEVWRASGNGVFNVPGTTSASASNVGALTVGNGTLATNVAIGGGNINAGGTITIGKPLITSGSALSYAAPTSVDTTLASFYTVTTVNATGSVTFNATNGGTAGQRMTILIVNDATSGKTITFGTNFRAASTLVGTISKAATIEFISDGTSFYEVARATVL